MLVSAAKRLASSSRGSALSRVASAAVSRRHFIASSEDFGTHQFSGAVADEYLSKQGLPAGTLDDPKWTTTSADKVAAAVMDWAHDKGASVYTHWFQPLGASGLRHGLSGQVQNAMFAFGPDGKVKHEFKGKELLKGETDGSSYPNGGMRATHTAGGYTIIDPTSPIFLRGDTVFIPTVFVSFYGDALDEKTPLLRSMRAVSDEACRLLKHLGLDAKKVQPNIGLEQEFFLIPREAYFKRPDLQFAGRTIMGRSPPRGQELCDHYMSPLNQVAMACMQEIQHEAFKMGIPLNTRHREVAPNQYECAPYFGIASNQIDENLMVMQLIEEIAAKHGLVGLLHEKPFMGINGSGKHNNFSLGTDTGVNLLNVGQLTKATGNPEAFPLIMACVVRAVDLHGDLMRMAIASPGDRIACLGLAYKADTDDLRESPAIEIVEALCRKHDGEIMLVEPNIAQLPPRLSLPNAKLVAMDDAMNDADVLALLVDHREFKAIAPEVIRSTKSVDTRGLWCAYLSQRRAND